MNEIRLRVLRRVTGEHSSVRRRRGQTAESLFAWTVMIACALVPTYSMAGGAGADGARQFDTAASFTFENDLFFDTDKYYTDGVQLTIKQRNLQDMGEAGLLARRLCGAIGCPASEVDLVRHKVGQLMYTPVNITVAAPQPFDRPWAGLLYYTREYEFISTDLTDRTTLSTTVGVTGRSSLAESTQKFIHRTFTGETPRGWDNQIGGELGLMALIERRIALAPLSTTNEAGVQVKSTGSVRVALGNIMTFAGLGMTVSVGKGLESSSERMEPITTKRKRPAIAAASTDELLPESRSCVFSWLACSAFAAAEVRWVVSNMFLDGTLFKSSASVDKKALVADGTLGARLDFPGTRNDVTGPWFVSFAATKRSAEFNGRRGSASSQTFGALTVGTEF